MKIIILRKSRGITQARLAELCGTTQQQIARIENGIVDPRISTLRKIADALECEIAELFFTRTEFMKLIQKVAKKHHLVVDKVGLLHLNSLCARTEHVPSFHPFWEKIEFKKSKLIFAED